MQATLDVYNLVSRELLPTPAKSHYTFNMRDVSKVFQGICVCTRESIPKIDDLVRCWMHECERVFKDRLTNRPDQNWFNNKCKSLMDRHFKRTVDQVTESARAHSDYSSKQVQKTWLLICRLLDFGCECPIWLYQFL